jgi:catechol 2,3-dioxygenase-like lactoylglutathione lyase family enzyme
MLPTPGFHHLHLNSLDPDAAIDFYVRQFPTSSKGTWAGLPALLAPNTCMILFNKIDTPPVAEPQSAIWHFGWHVPDARATLETFKTRSEVKLQPLYTTDEGGSVLISSDTWPNIGTTLGLTKPQIEDARRSGAYLNGPDNALIEFAGNHGTERFNHVHMWQEHPFCALLWYQKHLNAPVRPGFADTTLTETNCQVARGADKTWPALKQQGMYRTPRAGVEFGDVVLTWYANQGDTPLISPRGQLQDHIALSVTNLDAWITKLRDEGVTFLEDTYSLGDTRAVMIEGPSREALELVEAA